MRTDIPLRSGVKRWILLLSVLAFGFHAALGQPSSRSFEKEGLSTVGLAASQPARPLRDIGPGDVPYRVLHYDLNLHPYLLSEYLSGTVTISLLLTAPTDSVLLNAAALQIDSIAADGALVGFNADSADETITVSLGRTRPSGDTVHLRILYERLPSVTRPAGREGYYFFPVTIGIPANLGYTMSEPSDAHFWYPCLDEPWAKATAEIRATVPQTYVAASNGKLVGMQTNGDGTVTWHWVETHRIAPYLICVTASRFTVSTLPFVRAPNDTIPLQYYSWYPDSSLTAQYLPTVAQMVTVLSRLYGPYPFDKYGMTTIVPFAYGGMEHQTITTLNDYYSVDPSVVVHELGHQWWGDLVTCGSWPDVWLNEGFASYTEALWAEATGGPDGLRTYMHDQFAGFQFASWQGAVYDPVSQGYNLFDQVVYSKAAWALHTLRGVVGDSVFFRTLAAYRAKYAQSSATTAQFAGVVDSVAGSDMSWFFNQWIYGKGWPILNANYSWSADTLRVKVDQLQQASWPLYRLPTTLKITSALGSMSVPIVDSLRSQVFTVPLASMPVQVVFDPDEWILKQISGTATATSGLTTAVLEQNYPNPLNNGTQIQFAIPAAGAVKIRVFDVLGREVTTAIDAFREAGRYVIPFDATALASGVYFYRFEVTYADGSGSPTVVRKMVVLH